MRKNKTQRVLQNAIQAFFNTGIKQKSMHTSANFKLTLNLCSDTDSCYDLRVYKRPEKKWRAQETPANARAPRERRVDMRGDTWRLCRLQPTKI